MMGKQSELLSYGIQDLIPILAGSNPFLRITVWSKTKIQQMNMINSYPPS